MWKWVDFYLSKNWTESKSKIRISEETQRFALAIFLEWGAEMTQIPEKPTISVWFGIVDLSEL